MWTEMALASQSKWRDALYMISRSHNGVVEDLRFLGCYTMSIRLGLLDRGLFTSLHDTKSQKTRILK